MSMIAGKRGNECIWCDGAAVSIGRLNCDVMECTDGY